MSRTAESASKSPPVTIPLFTRMRDSDGFVGTVVYVGSVASSKNPEEQYAGIVWDDTSRGKHDGSVVCRRTNKIVRHFSCGPTQGSFLRPKKIDFGIALTAKLLREKYVEMNAPVIAPNNILPHSATTSSGREKTIEFLGELQIRKHQQLENIDKISLRREGIARACDENSDSDSDSDGGGMSDFRHIRDIDLAGNLLSNWDETVKIMRQFPLLETFSLAHNSIRDMDTTLFRFDNIKTLNLNNCCIQSFRTIQIVSETMPNLESLCIANSDLSDIKDHGVGPDAFRHLRQLDCSGCGFHQWEHHVGAFAALPRLESLSIDENPLPSIPPGAGAGPLFPSLVSLQLSGTAVSTWGDLEAVNSFGSLGALRFGNLPLTASLGEAEVRSAAIARFPGLEFLNASRISHEERLEAERRYVTLVSYSLQKLNRSEVPGSTGDRGGGEDSPERTAILDDHPRYPELMEKHNKLAALLTKGTSGGGSLAASVYNLTIRSMAAASCTMDPVVRRLPGSMTVERTRALCSRAFGVDYDLVRLRFRTGGDDNGCLPVEMDEDHRTLDYYGLCDGAEVLVDEADPRAVALESERTERDLERRMADHGRTIAAMQKAKTGR